MLYPFEPDETPPDRICRIVRDMIGCSLHENPDKLRALVDAAGPAGAFAWHTNCATFALAVIRAAYGEVADAGRAHPLLGKPLEIGKAFAWLVTIGKDLAAWRYPHVHGPPVRGAVMWYEIPPTNDHAEFDFGANDPSGFTHAGGGRPGNTIAGGTGTVDLSAGRPLMAWLDPEALGIGVPVQAERPTMPEVG